MPAPNTGKAILTDRYIGNRHFRLADLVRASTAAPYYFEPQEIAIVPGQPPGLFVDGGITPHNNPALALLQLATIPAYGYAWPAGADRLRIISVGTGSRRDRMNLDTARRAPAAQLGIAALASMVTDSSNQVPDHAPHARPHPFAMGAQLRGRRPWRLHPLAGAAVQLSSAMM